MFSPLLRRERDEESDHRGARGPTSETYRPYRTWNRSDAWKVASAWYGNIMARARVHRATFIPWRIDARASRIPFEFEFASIAGSRFRIDGQTCGIDGDIVLIDEEIERAIGKSQIQSVGPQGDVRAVERGHALRHTLLRKGAARRRATTSSRRYSLRISHVRY